VSWISGAVGILFIIIAAVFLLVFGFSKSSAKNTVFRNIPGLNGLRRAIGLAVEDGSRVHVSLGKASLNQPESASALIGLNVVERISQLSSLSDRPPMATSGDGGLAILSQDVLRRSYNQGHAKELYDPDRGRMTGAGSFGYIVGAMPVVQNEMVSTNILVGNFGPEVALLTDAADKKGQFTVAASDSLSGQSVLYACAPEPLIGEELFAIPAFLQGGRFFSASLRTQDILRWIVIGVMLVGAALKLVGVL
jgi:hypothetical protein